MNFIGIIGIISLLGIIFWALFYFKHPQVLENDRVIEESRAEAYNLIQRVKNKRKK